MGAFRTQLKEESAFINEIGRFECEVNNKSDKVNWYQSKFENSNQSFSKLPGKLI